MTLHSVPSDPSSPARRAVLRGREDRGGDRGDPGHRADDRRRASWPPGPPSSSPPARPMPSRPPWPTCPATASAPGTRADLSDEDGARQLADEGGRRPPTRSTCWSTTPAPPGGRRWPSTTRLRGTGCSTSTCRGSSTPPSSSCPCSRPEPRHDEPSRVINIGSIDGIHVPVLESYSYSASKAAVHQLTRHLAKRLAPTITVNAVAPGPFESKMMAATLEAFGDQIAAGRPAQADRPARRHGRCGHLPGLPGRRLPHRRHHPRRRRASPPPPEAPSAPTHRRNAGHGVRRSPARRGGPGCAPCRGGSSRVDVAQLQQHPLVVGGDVPASPPPGSRRRPARARSARSVRPATRPQVPVRARSARRSDGPARTRSPG